MIFVKYVFVSTCDFYRNGAHARVKCILTN